MKLNVPLVRQPKNSSECGIASVAMLLEYYGVPCEYEKLRGQFKITDWGTASPQLGLWLLQHGFEVEIVTMHPALFNSKIKPRTKEGMLRHLKSLRPAMKKPDSKLVLGYFIKFVEAGGKILPKVPGIDDIKSEISAKRPLIALLTHWFLHKTKEPCFTFHFNVVTGIDDKSIYVNDPDWNSPGGKSKHDIQEYLYAVYASAYGEIDNACFIKVKRGRNLRQKP